MRILAQDAWGVKRWSRPRVAGMAAGLVVLWMSVGPGVAAEWGDVSADVRLRFDTAEIDGAEDADALTLRARVGYATPVFHGFKAMVEGEFTGVADKDSYNAAGVHGDPTKAVIADPENAQLDQGYLRYTAGETGATVGRQRIALDNHRFVGDVGWRQNRQTFDAVSVLSSDVENLTLFYGYVDNVVRIFGSEAPDTGGNAGEAGSDSHLVNVSYLVHETAKVTGYAYLLDLQDIPATASSESYGLRVQGTIPAGEEWSVGYAGEVASQRDGGDNPLDYRADYVHVNVDGGYQGFLAQAGYEVLGADAVGDVDENGAPVYASFQTPLATLHKFNGFADRFLVTPPKGLRDLYAMVGYTFEPPRGGPWILKAWYHDFTSDLESDDLGEEWDLLLVKPFELSFAPGTFKALAKYADYGAGDSGADTTRATIELNYGLLF